MRYKERQYQLNCQQIKIIILIKLYVVTIARCLKARVQKRGLVFTVYLEKVTVFSKLHSYHRDFKGKLSLHTDRVKLAKFYRTSFVHMYMLLYILVFTTFREYGNNSIN